MSIAADTCEGSLVIVESGDTELTVDDMVGCDTTEGNVVVKTTVPGVITGGSVSC
jgi:hypothetical protein